MKRTDPKPVGEIVNSLLDQTGMTGLFREQQLCHLWPEIVGQGINRLTTRRFVDNGVLHVYLTSAVLKNELSFERTRLVEALNAAVGSEVIHDVQFH